MSRSFKKTPIFGNTKGVSEKLDKRLANRSFRRTTNTCLASGKEPPFNKNQTSDIWGFTKDGKHFWKHAKKEDMRK